MAHLTFNLLGPQGSGKGTQAKALLNHFEFSFFEAGSTLRSIIATGGPLGKEIASYLDRGVRVPDQLMTNVMRNSISILPKGRDILFDSIMRSMGQFKLQKLLFEELSLPLPVIIHLNLDDTTAIDRLSKRRICSNCGRQYIITELTNANECPNCGSPLTIRHDDTPEAIKTRLGWYHKDTLPVIEYIRTHGTVIEIDAKPPINEVSKNIISQVEAYYQTRGLTPPIK